MSRIIKAISINEPWATYIAYHFKTKEIRSWKTSYRGPLLICASATPKGLFSGFACVVARLKDCRPMTIDDEEEALCSWFPEAYALVLSDVTTISPFPVKGRLGLFDCPIPDGLSIKGQS